MSIVGYFGPENANGRFQVLPGVVQKVDVGGILDVSRCDGCIQNEFSAVFLLLLFSFQLLF